MIVYDMTYIMYENESELSLRETVSLKRKDTFNKTLATDPLQANSLKYMKDIALGQTLSLHMSKYSL